MTEAEKLEKIRETANQIIYAWQNMEVTQHNVECFLVHPACGARAMIAIIDEGKYGLHVD